MSKYSGDIAVEQPAIDLFDELMINTYGEALALEAKSGIVYGRDSSCSNEVIQKIRRVVKKKSGQ